MDPLIIPIHTKVRGRARFKIKSLARSPKLRQWVDTEVQRLPGVNAVKINSLTGSLLVSFDPAVQFGLLTDLSPGLALLMEPVSPGIENEPPRDREEPLFSSRDMLDLFSESAVLTGGALTALGYGLIRYGPGSKAATLAYQSLAAAKVLHALTCRPFRPDSTKPAGGSGNLLLNAALVAALAVQAGTVLIPGLRRFLNVAPLNLADVAVVGLTASTTRRINRKIREKRRTE